MFGTMEPWGYGGYGQFHMVVWIIFAIAAAAGLAWRLWLPTTIRFVIASRSVPPQAAVLSLSNAALFSRLRSRSPEAACSRICSATSSGVMDLRTKKRRSTTTSFNACRDQIRSKQHRSCPGGRGGCGQSR